MQPLYEYVCHMKGHRNSKGELAEWVIKSHETGKILSSHKSEKKAKEHLQQMHIFRGEAADGFTSDSKGYKLIGESTYGNDMDKRIKIFMEGVSQLGLSSRQVDAIGKLTNACMESALTLPENFTDEDLAYRDDLEERRLDQVYDELYKLGVSSDTINDRGRENDFSFNTMYQLLKDVCADKGIPVPEIDGAEDDQAKPSDADVYEALYPDDAPTYGRRVSTSEDDYDPDNPNDTYDDMFYDGNGRVNELDPDEELEF